MTKKAHSQQNKVTDIPDEVGKLARDIARFMYDYDPYECMGSRGGTLNDGVNENISSNIYEIVEYNGKSIKVYLQKIVDENRYTAQKLRKAKELLRRLEELEQNKTTAS
jgi:hypothetical protein